MKRFTSLVLVFGLIFAWAIPIGAAAPTQGVAQFINAYIPFLFGDAKENGPDWLTRTDLQLHLSDSLGKLQHAVETVQPLGALPSGQAFWQGRLATDEAGTKPTLNLGLGYRTLRDGGTKLFGVNSFYDHSFENEFSRVGVGGEFFMGNFEARANAYFPTTGTVEISRTATERTLERAVQGYDYEVGGSLPKAPWAKVFLGGKTLIHEHSDNVSSLTARTEMQLTSHLRLEAGYQANPEDKYLKLAYTFGPSGRVSLSNMKKGDVKLPDLSAKLLQKVERDNSVRTETWSEEITGGVTGYVYGNGSSLVIRSLSTAPAGYGAVVGATAAVLDTSISTRTNSSGLFTLRNIPVGTVTIVVTAGSLTVQGDVTIAEDQMAQAPDTQTGATTGSVEGYIFGDETSLVARSNNNPPFHYSPVSNATIMISDVIVGQTDANGYFKVDGIAAGVHDFQARDGSRDLFGVTVNVLAGQTVSCGDLGNTVPHTGGLRAMAWWDGSNIVVSPLCPPGYAPATGAVASIDGTAIRTTVDSTNYFELSDIPEGTQKLRIEYRGLTVTGDVTIISNGVRGGISFGTVNDHLTATGTITGYVYGDGSSLIVRSDSLAPVGYSGVNGIWVMIGGSGNLTASDGHFTAMFIHDGLQSLSVSDGTHTVTGWVLVVANTTSPSGDFGTANGH